MTASQKTTLFLLRIAMGWMMFYAGITKVVDPNWSAVGYLQGAKNFISFYNWLLQPGILPIVNFMNEWGLTLLGVSLTLGVAVRLSSSLGALLMLLYYLPILDFPYPNPHSYIVDEHIIYVLVLILLVSLRAGRIAGLERWCSGLPICSRFPRLRSWLG